jgi:hypothetical protein
MAVSAHRHERMSTALRRSEVALPGRRSASAGGTRGQRAAPYASSGPAAVVTSSHNRQPGCYFPPVDEDRFWALVATSRREAVNNTELASRILFRCLRKLEADEVVEFVRLWERARSGLYSWPVTDAACLLLGTVEEEDLRQIQDWIISYGREAVEKVAGDPDNLVDLAADAGSARAEWFGEFLAEAHIVVSGTWAPGYDPDGPEDLIGAHTDLSDSAIVERQFPRLAAFRRQHPELGDPELR